MSPDVRAATTSDLVPMAAMAAELVRFHHGLDPRRFMLARGVEEGYRAWFGRELERPEAILLVAGPPAGVVGYCYGRVEGRDWNMLLDRHAALHDVYVDPAARGHRVASLLIEAFLARAKELGAPRVVLHTATPNESAQRLFAALGFRSTMIEMTREIE